MKKIFLRGLFLFYFFYFLKLVLFSLFFLLNCLTLFIYCLNKLIHLQT